MVSSGLIHFVQTFIDAEQFEALVSELIAKKQGDSKGPVPHLVSDGGAQSNFNSTPWMENF